jgi:hypothetical protein
VKWKGRSNAGRLVKKDFGGEVANVKAQVKLKLFLEDKKVRGNWEKVWRRIATRSKWKFLIPEAD